MRWPVAAVPMGLLVAAVVGAPAVQADTSSRPVVPGVVNYVEGEVTIGQRSLDANSIGTVQVRQGESLSTARGRAEMLLTPGVFMRLDHQSSVAMVSPSLSTTEVALQRGRALVEVDELHSENQLLVTTGGVTTRLLKTGLYDFDADQALLRVVDGKATVERANHDEEITSGWQVGLAGTDAVRAKFDMKSFKATDLYRWSDLRSQYLAEANVDVAGQYDALDPYGPGWYGPGWYGPGWYGAGWHWDPWASVYTFVPAGGVFSSAFGWSFYSPAFVPRFPARHLFDRDDGPAHRLAWGADHGVHDPDRHAGHGDWVGRREMSTPRR